MEEKDISDVDVRHLELMAGLGAIERALLLINDALRLQVVKAGPSSEEEWPDMASKMKHERKARRQDLAQALHEHGLTDSASAVLKQNGKGLEVVRALKGGDRVFVQHASFEGKVVAQTENTVKVLHSDTPGYCVWFSKRDVELIGDAP